MQKSLRYKDEFIQHLSDLIAINSVEGEAKPGAPFGEGPKAALDLFLKLAEQMGFRTENMDGYCGYVEFGPETEEMVAGVCHLDVVPAAGWPEAFEMKVTEDKLIGRGVMDDKGPALTVLYAMKLLKDDGYEPPCRVRLILGCNEETGMACMDYYCKHGLIPKAAFTADANFPVIHAEKGRYAFKLVWDGSDYEPDSHLSLRAHVGLAENVIPGEAEYQIVNDESGEVETYEVIGRMGHASTPEHAENAIALAMCDAEKRLAEKNASHPFVSSYCQLIGMDYNGQRIGANFSDEDSGRLTLNTGILHLEKDHGEVYCDVRFPVTMKSKDVAQSIHQKVAESAFEIEDLSFTEPLYHKKDEPLVQILNNIYCRISGEKAEPIAIGGGTYAKEVPNCLAFGPAFPGEEGNCHQKNESIRIDTVFKSCDIYADALKELAEAFSKK